VSADTGDIPSTLPDHLLRLALSRPADAYTEATRLLARRPGPAAASIAHQARAIVSRDNGHSAEALAELRVALRLAHRSADPGRAIEVEATLGMTLGLAGRTAQGLAVLDGAVRKSNGALAGRVLMRRANLLRIVGRYDEALADLRRGISLLRRADDHVWEARSRTNRFLIYMALGQTARADRDLAIAERLFAAAGQDLESAITLQNRADVAYQAGDLPLALGFLDEAEARYTTLGTHRPTVAIDRCTVLLAAGLAAEAVAATEAALRRQNRFGGEATSAAELLFAVATAAEAARQPALAAARAAAARRLFRRQGRHGWHVRASFIELQARHAAGSLTRRLRRQARELADQLETLNAPEAPAAHLLAGRLAAERGLDAQADRHFARAARFRHRGPAFGHASGWLAQALRAETRGAIAGVLAACRHGLRAAGEHQRSLAAPELRAHAAAYGADLAAVAQRHAIRRGDARMLLSWSERWRASALALPSVRPPDDRELAAELAALRDVVRRLTAASLADEPSDRLLIERRRLEEAIRSRTRRLRTDASDRNATPNGEAGDVGLLLDGLDDHVLVEITGVDGTVYATTAGSRRVRTHRVGTVAAAIREVDLVRFQLGRLAYGRVPPGPLDDLAEAGLRLQRALFGDAAADLVGHPVVVVPPARLHAVPWPMLPILRPASFVVAPSAATWLRAGRLPAPRRRRVVLVAGPGLPATATEITRIERRYPGALVLRDGAATAEATLAALDGAWTAHVSAHGVFRADNPLFSALSLDDGPLTVYDLCRLRRSPRRLVLSSCESAVAAPVGPDELLGTVTALVALGTTSLLASIVPVNDVATAPLMVRFHERLAAGDSFGSALCAVRAAADAVGDPVVTATALSFVALGR